MTGLLLLETALDHEASTVLSGEAISYMADNILLLRYARPGRDGYDRTIEVIKTRGSGHDARTHPLCVNVEGPRVGPEPSA